MNGHPPCVLDIGMGYTKMGFGGNPEPQVIIPSSIATVPVIKQRKLTYSNSVVLDDLDFHVGGDNSITNRHDVKHVVSSHGVEDWDLMEKFLNQCIFKYLRAEPEDHYFLITEQPLNSPENREYLAEMMFETFNVPGLHIAIKGSLVLKGLRYSNPQQEDIKTAIVVNSGESATHVVPIAEGYVIGSQIVQVPIGGRHITQFIQGSLRERESAIPSHQSYDLAKEIKERYCYMCMDLSKEYNKYDRSPKDYFKTYTSTNSITNGKFNIDVGYEMFMAPEVLFHPELVSHDYSCGLDEIVANVIRSCPIDFRRELSKNIVLSGGSTLFRGFSRRLLQGVENSLGMCPVTSQMLAKDLFQVGVKTPKMQRNAVWYGGSMLSTSAEFLEFSHSKQEYLERGPSICHKNHVFGRENLSKKAKNSDFKFK